MRCHAMPCRAQGFGKEKGWCPYFLARQAIRVANVVVYNYR